jgi:hypothetical protein
MVCRARIFNCPFLTPGPERAIPEPLLSLVGFSGLSSFPFPQPEERTRRAHLRKAASAAALVARAV